MYYKDLLEAFEQEKIQYLLVGGVSVTLYGVPRMTQDIDFVISTTSENIEKVVNVLKKLDYIPRLPVDPMQLLDESMRRLWIEEKNLKAFSFYHKTHQYRVVDILLVHNLDFHESYENRNQISVWGMKINLVSVGDLIKMKEFSGREKDLSDVEIIKQIFDIK